MILRRRPIRERARYGTSRRSEGMSFPEIRDEVNALSDIAYLLREDFQRRERTEISYPELIKTRGVH